MVAYEKLVMIGPASAIAVGGFFKALKNNYLYDGDTILINVVEGVNRAAEYMDSMNYTTQQIDSVNECKPFRREDYKNQVWRTFNEYFD